MGLQVPANQSQAQIQSRAFITSVVSIFLSPNITATFFIRDGFRTQSWVCQCIRNGVLAFFTSVRSLLCRYFLYVVLRFGFHDAISKTRGPSAMDSTSYGSKF